MEKHFIPFFMFEAETTTRNTELHLNDTPAEKCSSDFPVRTRAIANEIEN